MVSGEFIGWIVDLIIKLGLMTLAIFLYFSPGLRAKIRFIPERYKWIYIVIAIVSLISAIGTLRFF